MGGAVVCAWGRGATATRRLSLRLRYIVDSRRRRGRRREGHRHELVGLDNRRRDTARGGARVRERAVLPGVHWQRGDRGGRGNGAYPGPATLGAMGNICDP